MISSNPRDEQGFISAGWTTVPFAGAVGIAFLAPFLVLLRGKLPFLVGAVLSAVIAVGAGVWFSIGELAAAPPLTDATPLQYALNNTPFYVFIFGIGVLIAWVIARRSRAFRLDTI